ncbi:MAG TPA: hypothetical protein DCE56_09605 [Cyanobacteria bacterium UBA8553]|nr:hypothetical protein [Cyanobacteria bacterium UBA8553]HAJ61348.1 hypothetical protein [Cyanobacteria bacterium UBA8543]
MSDGMAFLTGAAFAGVAVLFMLKGGTNLGATNVPPSQPMPISPTNTTNPYDPYGTTSQTPNPALSPGSPVYNLEQQRLENDRLRAMLEQQRIETERLKAQMQSLQNQQSLSDPQSPQNNPNNPNNSLFARGKQTSAVASAQQTDNSLLSGLVWALGGMAVTVSGGVVVVGALSMLSRQQRPPRTTYVVQQPYAALPPTPTRRRTEVIPPHVEERHVDYIEYDR